MLCIEMSKDKSSSNVGSSGWERAWRPDRTTFTPLASDTVPGTDPATNTYRYDMKDVTAYVLTLCAVTLVGSLIAELAVERALGVQFVVGWFALDLCWSPESKFVKVESIVDYASFALPTAISVAAWWMWGDTTAFAVLQGVLAGAAACYWIFTENGT